MSVQLRQHSRDGATDCPPSVPAVGRRMPPWVPIPVFLYLADLRTAYDPPMLLLAFSLVFSTWTSAVVAYLTTGNREAPRCRWFDALTRGRQLAASRCCSAT